MDFVGLFVDFVIKSISLLGATDFLLFYCINRIQSVESTSLACRSASKFFIRYIDNMSLCLCVIFQLCFSVSFQHLVALCCNSHTLKIHFCFAFSFR